MDDLIVRRFAIKYNPPTLVIEYKNKTGLFLKKIKLKPKAISEEKLCDKLIQTYPNLLGPDKVDREQLLDLLTLLLSSQEEEEDVNHRHSNHNYHHSNSRRDNGNNDDNDDESESHQNSSSEDVDLNKADDEELLRAKRQMDVRFSKNRVLPTDPNYVYDKQVEFQEPEEDCDWDDD